MPERRSKASVRELAIPPGAIATAGSTEVLRAFIVDGGLHVSLDPAFPNPDVWGVLLADIARHAARAYAADDNCGETEALARIQAMLEAELDRPTDRGSTQPTKKQ